MMMRTRLPVKKSMQIFAVALLTACYAPLLCAQQSCTIPTLHSYTHKKTQYAKVNVPGNYCLNKDLYSPRVFRWTEGSEEDLGQSLFIIAASHVTLDLMGHEVNKQWKGSTSTMIAGGADDKGRFNTHAHVKNGTLINRTGTGFNSSPWDSEADWPLLYRYAGYEEDTRAKKFVNPDEIFYSKIPEKSRNREKRSILTYNNITWKIDRSNLSPFPATKHQLENLRIEATGNEKSKPDWKQDLNASRGIIIKGAQNIIRNCTIEVTNTDAGIYLFGPGQIIENNTIIFKGHLPQGMSAPIRLSLADGSIIRNNTIIVKNGGKDQPAAAISLIDSRGVVIENNTIKGVDALYRVWDELPEQKTTVVEKENRMKSWWQVF